MTLRRVCMSLADAVDAPIHAAVYAARADVGAVAVGGGKFGRTLALFSGAHAGSLRRAGAPSRDHGQGLRCAADLAAALRRGGNAALVGGQPVLLGMTAKRLALNAELFEKCAKAYVLAQAAGGPTHAPAWWARAIAGRRLIKDERRAAQRFAQGQPPEDNDRY